MAATKHLDINFLQNSDHLMFGSDFVYYLIYSYHDYIILVQDWYRWLHDFESIKLYLSSISSLSEVKILVFYHSMEVSML